MNDNVNNPKHYVEASVRVEPIDLLRYAPFDFGNAMKYVLRAGLKGNRIEDLKKARWYLQCADESSDYDYEPYQKFFAHHGAMFRKFFPRLENGESTTKAFTFITAHAALKRYVEGEIFDAERETRLEEMYKTGKRKHRIVENAD